MQAKTVPLQLPLLPTVITFQEDLGLLGGAAWLDALSHGRTHLSQRIVLSYITQLAHLHLSNTLQALNIYCLMGPTRIPQRIVRTRLRQSDFNEECGQ